MLIDKKYSIAFQALNMSLKKGISIQCKDVVFNEIKTISQELEIV